MAILLVCWCVLSGMAEWLWPAKHGIIIALRCARERQIVICRYQKPFGQHPKLARHCGLRNNVPNRYVLWKGDR